eukprot:scaffold112_cov282-Prasinococcus_capsulatus_cf.AAC.3
MERGTVEDTYFRNWLLAQEGSPTMITLMSPRKFIPSFVSLWFPPKSMSKMERLISSCPKTPGATLPTSLR